MQKRNLIFICSFFFSLGGNILNFTMVYYLADRFSLSPGSIGFCVALGQFFYFSGCNLYHRFGSAFNPVKVLCTATAGAFLVSVPLGFLGIRFLAYAFFWLLQMVIGLYWPSVMSWVTAGLEAENLSRQVSLFNRSWMGANMVGPLIAGPLYQWKAGANFIVISLFYLGALCLAFTVKRFFPGEKGPEKSPALPGSGASPEQRGLDRKLDLFRYRGWINNFFSSMFVGIITNVIPLYIRDGLGYTERSAGIVLFLRCASGFAGFVLLARFSFWHFNRRWFTVLQGALICAILLFLPAGNRLFMYFAVVFLFGFVNSGCYTNSIFYSGAAGPHRRKNLAIHEIFVALGNAAGTAGGGIVYQRWSFPGVCVAFSLLLAASLAALLRLNRKESIFPQG